MGLARAQLGRGDAPAALTAATEAVEQSADRGLYGADAHLVLARALLHSGGTDAREAVESALRSAQVGRRADKALGDVRQHQQTRLAGFLEGRGR